MWAKGGQAPVFNAENWVWSWSVMSDYVNILTHLSFCWDNCLSDCSGISVQTPSCPEQTGMVGHLISDVDTKFCF